MSGGVIVIGSANLDHVVQVERAPESGETVAAHRYTTSVGGKGLNQAIAAGRAGAATRFIGGVGDDAAAQEVRDALEQAGIDAGDLLVAPDIPTGTAHIVVDAQGENRIVVAAGANDHLDVQWISSRRPSAAVAMLQLEIPRDVTAGCAELLHGEGVLVMLTPAPLDEHPLPAELFAATDVLALNAIEAQTITGRPGVDAVDALLDLVPAVVLTLGGDGAMYAARDGVRHRVHGTNVDVVDTTAAGDTFAGYFAAELAAGHSPERAVEIANAAAAVSVGRSGAVTSIPHRDEIRIG